MGQIHPKDGAEGHRVREPHRQMNYPCWQLSYTLHRFGGGNHPNCRRTVLVHSLMGEHFSREEVWVRVLLYQSWDIAQMVVAHDC